MPRQRNTAAPDHPGGLKKPDQPANDRESESRLDDASTGGLKKPDRADSEAKIDEAVDESFPASDPPAFNRGHSGAPAERDRNDIEKP